MQIVRSIDEWKKIRKSLNQTIGFVPTMGNLHIGHASLIEHSKNNNQITIVSIFVNPSQFNNKGDFEKYPKTLDSDIKILQDLGVDYLLLPDRAEIYPDDYTFQINNDSEISKIMEGEYRPGHFSGMLTIVLKLLLLTSPTNAYFGEKDYQQYILVKELAKAFLLDTNIISCSTIRNEMQLPLSSRNNRLNAEELEKASLFSQLLASNLKNEEIIKELEANDFKVDYIETYEGRRFGAVWLNNVRLIDNVKL